MTTTDLTAAEIAAYHDEIMADAIAYSDKYRETGVTKFGELARINFGIARECREAVAA